MSIICLVIIIINIYLHFDTRAYQNSTTNSDAQAGIGPATIFIVSWTLTSMVSAILFLVTIVMGIKLKELFTLPTILIIGLIILTFVTPIVLVNLLDYSYRIQ